MICLLQHAALVGVREVGGEVPDAVVLPLQRRGELRRGGVGGARDELTAEQRPHAASATTSSASDESSWINLSTSLRPRATFASYGWRACDIDEVARLRREDVGRVRRANGRAVLVERDEADAALDDQRVLARRR